MQTIETRFHGATNSLGARISARTSEGKLVVFVPYEHDGMESHIRAVRKLRERLKWNSPALNMHYVGSSQKGEIWGFDAMSGSHPIRDNFFSCE
jgi:hypothetical protein